MLFNPDLGGPIHSIKPVLTQSRLTTTDYYIITISPDINAANIYSGRGGGNIIIQRILSTIPGYPNPNYYRVALARKFNNIGSVRLISSEMPNMQDTIETRIAEKGLKTIDGIFLLHSSLFFILDLG